MVDILREHDRSIQEAVRKARCPTRTESCKMDEWGQTVNAGPKTPGVRSSKSWNGSTAFFHKASLKRGKLIRTTADVEKMMLGHMVDIFQQLKINTRILAKTSLPSEMIRAFVWNVYCWAWKNLWGGCLRNTSQGLQCILTVDGPRISSLQRYLKYNKISGTYVHYNYQRLLM
jgi:hypothetical protein